MEDEKLVYYCYNRLDKNHFVTSNKDDLIQEGFIGLMNAKKTYDESKNIKFSTYAISCIKNSMSNYIRASKKHNSNISLNETLSENFEIQDTLQIEEFTKIEDKLIINEILSKNFLKKEEKEIITMFLQGYSKAVIKKKYGLKNIDIYKIFNKIKCQYL